MSKPHPTTYMATFLAIFTAVAAHAMDPVLAEKGKLLLEDDFNAAVLCRDNWSVQKSKTGIELRNGRLVYDCSRSQDADSRIGLTHALDPAIADFVLELQLVPRPGFGGMNIVLNDDIGHCLVVTIKPGLMYGYKFAEQGKRSFAEYVDCTGIDLSEGQTYLVKLEKAGRQMFLYIDDKHFLIGQHPRFENPLHRVGLTFLGGQGELDDFKLWEGIAQATSKLSRWKSLQPLRPIADLDRDPKFRESKLTADARQQLETDDAFQKLTLSTNSVFQDIQRQYPFFRSARGQDQRKHKEASQKDAVYAGLLLKLSEYERKEIDYIYSRFPSIRSGKSKGSSN